MNIAIGVDDRTTECSSDRHRYTTKRCTRVTHSHVRERIDSVYQIRRSNDETVKVRLKDRTTVNGRIWLQQFICDLRAFRASLPGDGVPTSTSLRPLQVTAFDGAVLCLRRNLHIEAMPVMLRCTRVSQWAARAWLSGSLGRLKLRCEISRRSSSGGLDAWAAVQASYELGGSRLGRLLH